MFLLSRFSLLSVSPRCPLLYHSIATLERCRALIFSVLTVSIFYHVCLHLFSVNLYLFAYIYMFIFS